MGFLPGAKVKSMPEVMPCRWNGRQPWRTVGSEAKSIPPIPNFNLGASRWWRPRVCVPAETIPKEGRAAFFWGKPHPPAPIFQWSESPHPAAIRAQPRDIIADSPLVFLHAFGADLEAATTCPTEGLWAIAHMAVKDPLSG